METGVCASFSWTSISAGATRIIFSLVSRFDEAGWLWRWRMLQGGDGVMEVWRRRRCGHIPDSAMKEGEGAAERQVRRRGGRRCYDSEGAIKEGCRGRRRHRRSSRAPGRL